MNSSLKKSAKNTGHYEGERIAERTRRIIERELDRGTGPDAVTISSIAAALGISVSHLSRTFRQVTGETFEHFVMRRRIDLAKRLLLDPGHNVGQVAERCRFADPSYFTRVFRKLTGLSPREYCQNPHGVGRPGPA